MKQRQAKKILKYRDKLNYSPDQLKRAEQKLDTPEKSGAKGDLQADPPADEKTE